MLLIFEFYQLKLIAISKFRSSFPTESLRRFDGLDLTQLWMMELLTLISIAVGEIGVFSTEIQKVFSI
jgi:hypothetical protein